MHDRQSESSSSAQGDQSSPMIVAVIRTRRNQSRRSNCAGTLEQLREVKERRVGRACTQCGMGPGNQWRISRRSGVTWSNFLLLQMSLAAALSTDWSLSRRHAGAPASRLLQRSTREVIKAATAAFVAPRGSDSMQLLMRRSWRKQQPTVHATWRLMDRPDSSRTPRSRTEVEGRIKAPQTISSAVSRWDTPSAVRTPQEVRLLGVEPQSVGTHPFGDPLNTKFHTTPLLWNCRWRAPRVKLRVIGVEVR